MDPAPTSEKKERFDDAVFASGNLEHRRLEVERELQSLKWVGYRFLTPLAATRLFYDEYRARRIDYVREHTDVELADSLPKVSFEKFIKDPAKLAAAWSARQAADACGVPYDLYIGFSLWFWSRRSGGGRAKVPQINQLGYNKKTEQAWLAEFNKYRDEHVGLAYRTLADVPQLLASSFVGTPEQNHARDVILGHCRRSSASLASLIETWCYSYPILTPDCFETIFPADVVASAMEIVDTSCATSGASAWVGPSLLWPACHGLPNTLDATHEQCTNCAVAESCGKFATIVKTEVLRRTGREEPRKTQLRAAANKRMRDLRARKKAGAAGSAKAISSLPGTDSSVPEAVL
ncbi:MAG TPA: hypothetical protein VIL88_15695 [Devosia sp.]|jgi:hypothetical protein|uniref:hypothetical protein n=1 Tax=Devosia sp. TaxID=1871048 RepID=UPI002F93B152